MPDETVTASDKAREPAFFYGWVIVIALFIIMLLIYGVFYSFTVFLKELAEDQGAGRALVSGLISVTYLLHGPLGILAGIILDRRGPRLVLASGIFLIGLAYFLASQATAIWHLYLYLGLLLGIGMSPGFVISTATVGKWFEKRRGLAQGILLSSIGVGQMVMPPLAERLISLYSWQTAYLIMGLTIWAVALPLTLLLRRSPQDMGLLPDGETAQKETASRDEPVPVSTPESWTSREAMRTRPFWLLFAIWVFLPVSIQMLFIHISPYATDVGIAPAVAATIVTVLGLSGIVGGITIGGIADRVGSKPTFLLCLLFQAGALLGFIVAGELWMFYLLAVIFGLAVSGGAPVYLKIVAGLFGPAAVGAIIGIVNYAWSIGSAVSPWLAGYIFDATGTYTLAFIVGASTVVLTLLFALPLRSPKPRPALDRG